MFLSFNDKQEIPKRFLLACTIISASLITFIIVFFLFYAKQVIFSPETTLWTNQWNPSELHFGILPMLYGSLMVTFVAIIIATPLGLGAAIFTAELLPTRHRLWVKSLLEILAGIPSIIYGLIGIVFLSIWIENWFDLQSGRTLLTAGILLALMILPTITTLCDDALRNVPKHYRESSASLGLFPYEVISLVLLPMARKDIIGALLLALGRALGETMAVMLVIGSIDKIPQPFYNLLNAGQTITSKLGREISESAFGSLHFSALIFMSLSLLIIVLLLTAMALFSTDNEHRIYE